MHVLLGGVDLETIAPIGDLEDSTIWRTEGGYSGDYEASWTWGAPADFGASWFHAGAEVEIVEDGLLAWSGFLGDPQHGDRWSLAAFGWGADAANYASSSAAGNNLNDNIDDAISRGLGFARHVSLSAASPAGGAVMLNEALDIAAKILGKVWWVSSREVDLRSEATTLDWMMAPDSAYLGTTDEELITGLIGRYVSAVDGDGNPSAISDVMIEDDAAAEKFRPHERVVNLTPLGYLDSGSATFYTEARFAQVGARAGFTNGFTMTGLNSADASTTVPDPMGVRAGDRVQLPGITDLRTGVTYLAAAEVTLGKVRRRHSERIALCEPVGLVARDLSSALAAAQPRKARVMEL